MTEPTLFYDISPLSLMRHGEEVCGDQVKVLRTSDQSIAVLADGLGSGIQAAILARLTTEIIVTMLREAAPLREVMATVTGTLPVSREHGLAYATFVVVQIQHQSRRFQLVNFGSPEPVFLRRGRILRLPTHGETFCGKPLSLSEGVVEERDLLCLMSDGVFAAKGGSANPNWGWNQIATYLEETAAKGTAERAVQTLLRTTQRLYGNTVGDDVTLMGILARKPRRLMVFTGPPANPDQDTACVDRLIDFPGRRVICGGTTANIVSQHTGQIPQPDESTRREELPAIATMPDIDLITEGILTMARTLELLKACDADAHRLPVERNGAVLLARELLLADSILFLAGESVNPFYQNPQLPRSVSIRQSLVSQIAEVLTRANKEVKVEWI